MQILDQIEYFWDLYKEKKYHEIIKELKNLNSNEMDESLKELYYLAMIEIDSTYKVYPTNGIFKELVSGMYDFKNQNYLYATNKLSKWLLNKGFYTDLILDRFFISAKDAHQYNLILRVCEHFLNQKNYNSLFVKEMFYAYFNLRQYENAIKIFELYREMFDDNDLQVVGIILLKLKKFKEAERILLGVYKKITGREYQNQYEKYEEYYKSKHKVLKEKYIKNQIEDDRELIEFAMSCLFTGDYRTSLQIFSELKNKLEKVA